jgi:predicted nucleic acid-binding protein
MSGEVWYLDSSALVKTVVEEPESGALIEWLVGERELAACDLVRVEAIRAVRVSDPGAVERARSVLRTLTMIRLDPPLLDRAAEMEPASLRSLDAIHLAAALSLGSDLAGVVTYDVRMAEAAERLGLAVAAPAK